MGSPYVCETCRSLLRSQIQRPYNRGLLPTYARSGFLAGRGRSPLSTSNPFNVAQQSSTVTPIPPTNSREEPLKDTERLPSSEKPRLAGEKLRERAAGVKQFSLARLARIAAESLRKNATVATETYVAYGSCEKLVQECVRQADYTIARAEKKNVDIPKSKDGEDIGQGEGWWYSHLGLTPTFNTWAQVTFLHMYMLTCRFRMFDQKIAPIWHQHLISLFSYKAEERMHEQHGIVANSIRQKYLKDLFVQWRGLTAGYDEGLVKGDAVLATAIWRNIFRAGDEVDFRHVQEVMGYMRGALREMEQVQNHSIESAGIVFNDPKSGKKLVETGQWVPKKLAKMSGKQLQDGIKASASL